VCSAKYELIGDIFIAVLAKETNQAFGDRAVDPSSAIAINHGRTGLASVRCLGLSTDVHPSALLCIFFQELVGVGLTYCSRWRPENNFITTAISGLDRFCCLR